jgi:outer membrane lipoprotein
MKKWMLMGMALFLAGCQTTPSNGLSQDVDEGITFEAVRKAPETYTGKRILAGGEIIAIHNLKEMTEIEVLQKPLGPGLRPILSDHSEGRFLVRHTTFLDPTIFKVGRHITVSGEVTGGHVVKIGEAEMTYPVLSSPRLYLWPVGSPDRYTPHINFGFGYSTIFSD